jgi:hypothetical protein
VHRAIVLTWIVALALAGLVLAGVWMALRPAGPPLTEATFSHTALSPNADGDDDVTHVSYHLRRAANISIYFLDSQDRRFDFRTDNAREAGEHAVDFSGVVEPFDAPSAAEPQACASAGQNLGELLPAGGALEGEVLARVLPDGEYEWVIEARDAEGQTNSIRGPLSITGADTTLPQLRLTVSPPVFTPNQDGLGDRVTINVWLNKEVDPDGLRLSLLGPEGLELPIAEQPTDKPYGECGLHAFDYDAGIDLDLQPPPDGAYLVRAVAEDRLGQKVQTQGELSIANGGLPRAEILFGAVDWSSSTVVLGNTLYFTLTVNNYGTAPIRTSGPWSGAVYDSMATTANTLGEYEESGAWRVGIMCQSCKSDYPWRWALGTPDNLTLIPDEAGNDQYYLLPGQRVTVSGGIVLDEVIPSLNPQYFWAGLIHEFVGIETINNRVDAEFITIVAP